MVGELSFFEIGAPDAAKARDFYARLLGWKLHPMGDGDGGWLETPTVRGGLHGGDDSAEIAVYFSVPDIENAIEKVRELGGTADEAGAPEPGFGRFTTCQDDQGIRFGLHQPAS